MLDVIVVISPLELYPIKLSLLSSSLLMVLVVFGVATTVVGIFARWRWQLDFDMRDSSALAIVVAVGVANEVLMKVVKSALARGQWLTQLI